MSDPAPSEERLHDFALALVKRDVSAFPALDPEQAVSPLADAARRADLNEDVLARELVRGISECKAGADHARYLKLGARWLGYRVEAEGEAQKMPRGTAAGGALGAAVAAALVGARAAGVLSRRDP